MYFGLLTPIRKVMRSVFQFRHVCVSTHNQICCHWDDFLEILILGTLVKFARVLCVCENLREVYKPKKLLKSGEGGGQCPRAGENCTMRSFMIFYSSPNISRMTRWAGRVARIVEEATWKNFA